MQPVASPVAAGLLALLLQPEVPDTGASGLQTPAAVVPVEIHMQAGSAGFRPWPGGGDTWHHGRGYLLPFGGASYFCGRGFPEAERLPLAEWQKALFQAETGKADPLFCIYRVQDGDFYVYDSVVASLVTANAGGGRRNQMINLVVGGTGPYEGATGIWLGLTEGAGELVEVAPGRRTPEVLMKVMNGYVKIPRATVGDGRAGNQE